MELIDLDGVLLGTLVFAFFISRVVQVANGRRVASVFSLSDVERIIFWTSFTVLCAASIYRTGWNAGNAIVIPVFLLVGSRTLREFSRFAKLKLSVKPAATNPGASSESN